MENQIEITMDTLAGYHSSGYATGRRSARSDLLPILTRALAELEPHAEGGCDCAHCEFIGELSDLVSEIKRGK